jgi:UDP-glucose 4-epimerase
VNVLVTGGAGFIGSHIATRLVQQGQQVRVLDNLSTGKPENLAHVNGELALTRGDIRDAELVMRLCLGCELVFHQAAVVSVPYSVEHPQETHDVNLQGTLNVLQAARAAGVRRVVFACSAAVYGQDPRLPKTEQMAPSPVSPYGLEKIAGEYYMSLFHQLYGVETVSLRYFNVFGPRQDPRSPYSGVISIFVDRLLAGTEPTVHGDGQQSRDFVFVDDVVQANLLASSVPRAAGRCYNVGRGQQTTLLQLLELLGQITGREPRPRHAEPRAGDIRASQADISRACAELGYDPQVEVREGLERLLASSAS